MHSSKRFTAFICALLVLLSAVAVIPEVRALSDLFVVDQPAGDVVCGASGSTWIPGKLGTPGNESSFKSFADLIKAVRQTIKKAKLAKKAKLQKQIATYTTLKNAQAGVCDDGPPTSSSPPPLFATPTPLFGPPPVFNSTPTPSPLPPIFDPFGNVNADGKAQLEIPSQLTANRDLGATVQQNRCFGCHVERTGRTFSNLRTNTMRAPMFFDASNLTDQDLANLTAYLNRFRS